MKTKNRFTGTQGTQHALFQTALHFGFLQRVLRIYPQEFKLLLGPATTLEEESF